MLAMLCLCYPITLFLVVAHCEATPICHKPFQVYATCGCPFTCEDDTEIADLAGHRVHVYRGRNCTAICKNGCQCDQRHYDDGNGNCVLAKDCPMPSCPGPNEHYILRKYPHCPYRSCRDMFGVKSLQFCGRNFEPGCVCKRNHVRSDNGTCTPVEQCPDYPPKCDDERMEFKSCVSPCQQRTCNYTGGPSASQGDHCNDECVSACFCKRGYVMNYDRICVLPEECPKEPFDFTCHEPNRVHLFCGPFCTKRCEYLDPPKVCKLGCNWGCFCKAGYVGSVDGCVRPENCDRIPLG